MLDLNRIFSHRPEAAATISGAPGYERLQGQVLFYPASGGTVVVAQLQGRPGAMGPGDHRSNLIHKHSPNGSADRDEPPGEGADEVPGLRKRPAIQHQRRPSDVLHL